MQARERRLAAGCGNRAESPLGRISCPTRHFLKTVRSATLIVTFVGSLDSTETSGLRVTGSAEFGPGNIVFWRKAHWLPSRLI